MSTGYPPISRPDAVQARVATYETVMTEREQQLEATLRDIIVGCDMLLPYATVSERRFMTEVKRVASAPLGDESRRSLSE